MASWILLLLCIAAVTSTAAAGTVTGGRRLLGAAPPLIYLGGPIVTNGKTYKKVCDPGRFNELGLDMADFAYCDAGLPYAGRVKDLVGRMSLSEKVAQLGDRARGSNRIGLPKYGWWSEALHGVADTGHATYFGDVVPHATSFANVILSAASFNETLWKRIGQAISTEARAMYNLGHTGLNFWSPNINIARDPRWGRILETPGEDPLVVGRYAVGFVRGLQDIEGLEITQDLDSRPLKVSACCKHYVAYDLENWFLHYRRTFDAKVAEQDMVETFARPFEMCVREGDASGIMCSFNKINGIPICADPKLMAQTFRDKWNLHGYSVSDCDSVVVISDWMHWLGDTPEDAVAHSINAGLDLDCGIGYDNYYTNYTLSAVAQGKVRESDIDNALKNLYMVLMRVGFFDSMPQFEGLGKDDICTEDNMELATDSARQGIVLLKNTNSTLPLLPNKNNKFALIGPHANSTDALIGNYAGNPCRYISVLDAFSKQVQADYKPGCEDVTCKSDGFIPGAVEAAKHADTTIIVAGIGLAMEREDNDRMDLLLPPNQIELINKATEAAQGRVVLVILSGGCLDVSFAENNPKIGAIIWAGYPGEEGGQAIADVVFGRYNPGGRLPVTWYKNEYVDSIPMTSMKLRPDYELGYPGRTYKFFNGPELLYPFGHGLSYTTFSYSFKSTTNTNLTVHIGPNQHCKMISYKPDVSVPPCPSVVTDETPCQDLITVELQVSNTGSVDGAHAVLVYSKPPVEVADAPLKQLVGFQRVFVAARGVETVKFELNACKALGIVEKTAYNVLPSGKHAIQIGDGDIAVSLPVEVNFDHH